MNQSQYLTHISRKNGKYEFRYEVPENITVQFVHPVYTNAKSMIDAIGISKNIKAVSTAVQTRINEKKQEVDERTAKVIYELFKQADMILSIQEYESVNGWTITLK